MNFITFTIKRQTLYCWIRKCNTTSTYCLDTLTYYIHAYYVSLSILHKLYTAYILHRYAEIIASVAKSSKEDLSNYRTLVVYNKPQKELPWPSKFIKAIYDVSKIESVLYYMLNKLNLLSFLI